MVDMHPSGFRHNWPQPFLDFIRGSAISYSPGHDIV